MICLYCSHTKTKVINSRPHKKQPQTWRRHQCQRCGAIFTTYERPTSNTLIVVRPTHKSQQSTQKKALFNIGKLTLSIARSAQHDQHQAEYDSFALASTVESELLTLAAQNIAPKEKDPQLRVTLQDITKTTHRTLKRFDELTALQYAMQHKLLTSVRRRGRPSTIATNDDEKASVHD